MKTKSFNFKINFVDKSGTLSGIFCLTAEQVADLMARYQENIQQTSKVKFEIGLPEVVLAASTAAQSPAELAYIFFRVGREHEQQLMVAAAQMAEKQLIPTLIDGKKSGEKETFN